MFLIICYNGTTREDIYSRSFEEAIRTFLTITGLSELDIKEIRRN